MKQVTWKRRLSAMMTAVLLSNSWSGLVYAAVPMQLNVPEQREVVAEDFETNTGMDVDGFKIENGMIPRYADYLKPQGDNEYGIATFNTGSERPFGNQTIESDYIEFVVDQTGRFTIGNREGRTDTPYDDDRILLFGHPSPRTSYTTVFIDGMPYIFEAESVFYDPSSKSATAIQTINGVKITEKLQIVQNSENGKEDTVQINYQAQNTSSHFHSVGFRIMMDTMLGDNDGAPFKIPGIGNVETELELKGNEIPKYWQAYDSLTNATVFAVGTLYDNVSNRPDKVQFANWAKIAGVVGQYSVTVGEPVTYDSAVAVYWDEKPLYENGIMAVKTAYGVGYADTSGVQNQQTVISNNQFGVLVTDTNGKFLTDVKVTMGERDAKTDNIGLATFTLTADMLNQSIEVRKDGYQIVNTTVDAVCGTVTTVVIPEEGRTSIKSVIAEYDGSSTNLLSEYLTFNEYKGRSDRDTFNDTTSKLKIEAEIGNVPENASYQIVQGTSILAESNQPIFEFEVYKFAYDSTTNYNQPALKKFKAGTDVELLVFSNGRQVTRKRLALRISQPDSFFDGIEKFEAGYKNDLTFKIPEGIPILENSELMIGTEKTNLPVIIAISDGKLKVGLNFTQDKFKKTFLDATNKKHEYYKALEEAKKGKFDNLESFLEKKRLHYGSTVVKGSVNVTGYGELSYGSEGRYTLALNVTIVGKINGSYTYQTFASFLPVYVKADGEASLTAAGDLSFVGPYIPDLAIENAEWGITLKLEPSLDLSAGVGFSGAFSTGVGGGLKLPIEYRMKNGYAKVDLNGHAFIEVYLTPFVHIKRKWLENTWNLYEGYHPLGRYALSDESQENPLFDLDNYSFIKLQNDIRYAGRAMVPDEIEIENPTLRGNAGRIVHSRDGSAVVFYLKSGDSVNGSEIVMEKIASDSNAERENPVPVATSSNAKREFSVIQELKDDISILTEESSTDLQYDIYSANDRIYLAVSKASGTLPDADSEASVSSFLESADIFIMEIEKDSMAVKSFTRITDNNYADLNPKIYADGNNVYVAWMSVEQGKLFEENTQYAINFYNVNTRNFKKTETDKFIYGLDVGKLNGNVKVVYSSDIDGKLETLDDVELFAYDGTSPVRMTNNDAADLAPQYDEEGHRLFWYSGGTIYETSNSGAGKKVYGANISEDSMSNDDAVSVSPDFSVITGNGATMIVWEEVEQESLNTVIYGVEERNKGWGNRFVLYRGEDYVTSRVDGFIDKNGVSLLHINTGNVYEDDEASSALILTRNICNTDLSIDSVEFDTDKAKLGETLPVTITVTNNGNTTVTEFTITIDEASETFSKSIKPGESVEVIMNNFEIPEWITSRTLFEVYVDVDAAKTNYVEIEEPYESYDKDNNCAFELGVTNLSVDTSLEVINGDDYINIMVTNYSYMPSGATVRLMADSMDGAVLYEREFEKIDAHTTQILKLRVSDITAGVSVADIYVSLTAFVTEDMLLDNTSCISIDDTINRYHLSVEVEEGGTVEQANGLYRQGASVALKAIPYDGFAFDGWTSTVKGIIGNPESAETVLTMPGEDVTVTAVFKRTNTSEGNTSQSRPHRRKYNGGSNETSVYNLITTSASCLTGGTWENTVGGWRLKLENGQYATNQWVLVDGKWYVFDGKNCMVTGWQMVNYKWYYLDPVNGDMKTGWIYVNGLWYYLDPINGDMKTDWIYEGSQWYYLEPGNGDMKTGWREIENQWYYFNPISNETMGALLVDTTTPDGYKVNEKGQWVE